MTADIEEYYCRRRQRLARMLQRRSTLSQTLSAKALARMSSRGANLEPRRVGFALRLDPPHVLPHVLGFAWMRLDIESKGDFMGLIRHRGLLKIVFVPFTHTQCYATLGYHNDDEKH